MQVLMRLFLKFNMSTIRLISSNFFSPLKEVWGLKDLENNFGQSQEVGQIAVPEKKFEITSVDTNRMIFRQCRTACFF
jgi:hypothetical protein